MYIVVFLMLIISFNNFGMDNCQKIKPIPSLDSLIIQMGATYCPSGCQTHYKIPKGETHNIWHKTKCIGVFNKSLKQPLFIPAKNLEIYSTEGVEKSHPTLGCVGDFFHTKNDDASDDCKKKVAIKILKCPEPTVSEAIEVNCDPGCWYMTEVEDEDTSTNPPKKIKSNVKKFRGGNGKPCTYYKKIELLWEGIGSHDPNNSASIVTATTYVINKNFDSIACTKQVEQCPASASGGGGGDSGKDPVVPPSDPGKPEKDGETTISN